MPSEALHIAVVDIGNLKNLGWVVDGPTISEEGTDIDLCIGTPPKISGSLTMIESSIDVAIPRSYHASRAGRWPIRAAVGLSGRIKSPSLPQPSRASRSGALIQT